MTNYELMARLLYGIGTSFPNIKTSKTYKFEFENFRSDKTVLWKTYVTYRGNAKERSQRTESVSFLYGIVHFSVKRTSRPVPFLLINYELMARLLYGIGTSFPNIKTLKTYKFEFENFRSDKTVL